MGYFIYRIKGKVFSTKEAHVTLFSEHIYSEKSEFVSEFLLSVEGF